MKKIFNILLVTLTKGEEAADSYLSQIFFFLHYMILQYAVLLTML